MLFKPYNFLKLLGYILNLISHSFNLIQRAQKTLTYNIWTTGSSILLYSILYYIIFTLYRYQLLIILLLQQNITLLSGFTVWNHFTEHYFFVWSFLYFVNNRRKRIRNSSCSQKVRLGYYIILVYRRNRHRLAIKLNRVYVSIDTLQYIDLGI